MKLIWSMLTSASSIYCKLTFYYVHKAFKMFSCAVISGKCLKTCLKTLSMDVFWCAGIITEMLILLTSLSPLSTITHTL